MTLFQLVQLLRKHVVQIAVIVLVCVVAATLVSFMMPRTYTSEASVYVTVRGEYDPGSTVAYLEGGSDIDSGDATGASTGALPQTNEQDLVLLTALAGNVAQIVQSQSVADRVLEALSISDVEELDVGVTVSSGNYITIKASWDSADVATAMVDELVKATEEVASEVIGEMSLRIIDPASTPEGPSNAAWYYYALVGFCAGLVIALSFLFLKLAIEESRQNSGQTNTQDSKEQASRQTLEEQSNLE